MSRRASQLITRNDGVAIERTRTREGCIVEREDVRHERGFVIGQHITLYTELELQPEVRETVLAR